MSWIKRYQFGFSFLEYLQQSPVLKDYLLNFSGVLVFIPLVSGASGINVVANLHANFLLFDMKHYEHIIVIMWRESKMG
jgi:hypothetical protein